MDHRNPRHVWEGVLNGAGFVIGSALVGWAFIHVNAILALSILIAVLWLILRRAGISNIDFSAPMLMSLSKLFVRHQSM
jgi:hypothetical protein